MSQNVKILLYDIKSIFMDKKTIILISFLTLITLLMSVSFRIVLKDDTGSLFTQFASISGITDKKTFIYFFTGIFSFIIFTTYPFIIGIVIISYLKEFGELELMMLFPIDRKSFFIEKIFCVFSVSLVFSWISILLNRFLLSLIMDIQSFNIYRILYMFIVLPVWIFFISCITIMISSSAKDSKEANQKSMILPFVIYAVIQLSFLLKLTVFSYKIILLPFIIGLAGSIVILLILNRKFSIERIIYS